MATKKLQLIGLRLVNEEDYGKNAYEIALDNGFVGTEAEWLESLQGKAGYTPVKGVDYYTPEERDKLHSDLVSEIAKQFGDMTELFDVTDTDELFCTDENGYYTANFDFIELAGCKMYHLLLESDEVSPWIGKTIKIKTYAYGDMSVHIDNDIVSSYLLNPTADIINDPASGVCEFEVTISENLPHGAFSCMFPFCENNGYTEPKIYVVKGIVWEGNDVDTIPAVTIADAGKFLRVSASGTWVVEAVRNAEEVAY